MANTTSERFGAEEYRLGALERLQESLWLLRKNRFAGSIYLAGRGAEGMLRALIWKNDLEIRQGKKTLDTGHDLRELLTRVRRLGLLRSQGDREFDSKVQQVGRIWFNNMRFASSRYIERHWRRAGELHKRRTFKQAATDFYQSCSAIMKRCEELYAGTDEKEA